VRHLPGDEDEVVAHDRRHDPEVGAEATPGGWIFLISCPRSTAISEAETVDPPPKMRSMTTEVLGGM
jgi:hypothetical protein